MPDSNTTNGHAFVTTHWSVIEAAADPHAPAAQEALAELCRVYWRPIYAYLRLLSRARQDAEDITQDFFCVLLRREAFARVTPSAGRFRSYLLASLKNYLNDHDAKARALKRGGAMEIIPLAELRTEETLAVGRRTAGDADLQFDRRWAELVVERATQGLRAEYARRGEVALLEALLPLLTPGGSETGYEPLARTLNMSAASLRVRAFRLRQRFRELVVAQVRQTVSQPADVAAEVRHLFTALAAA